MSDLFDFMDAERSERGQFDQITAVQALQAEETEAKRTRPDLFKEVLPSIQLTKKYITFEAERDYDAYMVNKGLSQYDDCIYYAQEMNMMYHLPPRMQYDYHFHAIRAKKRGWPAWGKTTKPDDLAAVKLYFGYSRAKALEALKLLSEEQLALIRKETKIEN